MVLIGWASWKVVSQCGDPGIVCYTGLVISKRLAFREGTSTIWTTKTVLSAHRSSVINVSTKSMHRITVFTICKPRIEAPAVWSHRTVRWTTERSGFTVQSPQSQISATWAHKISVEKIYISTVTCGT